MIYPIFTKVFPFVVQEGERGKEFVQFFTNFCRKGFSIPSSKEEKCRKSFLVPAFFTLQQERTGKVGGSFCIFGVEIGANLFGVFLGQHRAAHHDFAVGLLLVQQGNGFLHAF